MAGPWEKYGPSDGPWARYAPAAAARPTTNYGQTGVQAAKGGFLADANDQMRTYAHRSLADLRKQDAEIGQNPLQSQNPLQGLRTVSNAFNVALSPVAGLAIAGSNAARAAFGDPSGKEDTAYNAKVGDLATGLASIPVGNALASAAGRVGAAVNGVRDAITVPRSVTSLTPIEAKVIPKFVAKSKADVNAMTGEQARYAAAGVNPTLVDVAGNSGRRVIRAAASRPGPGSDAVNTFAVERSRELPERVGQQARAVISSDTRTPQQIQDQLKAARGKAADADYGAVRDVSVVVPPDMQGALTSDAGKAALRSAASKEPDPARRAAINRLIEPDATPAGSAAPVPTSPPPADVTQARADIDTYGGRQTGGLFRAIQERGGLKVKDGNGVEWSAGPDLNMADIKAPGLINNRSGMSPEYMAQSLHDAGWFGNVDDPSEAFASAFNRHASGDPVYHPSAYEPGHAEAMQSLSEEMDAAGVLAADSPQVAARKLAEHRFADEIERRAVQADGGSDPHEQEFDRMSGARPKTTTVGVLHDVSEVLGNQAEAAAAKEGGANDARKLRILKDLVRGPAIEQSPGYALANAKYASASRDMEAADTGTNFLKPGSTDEFVAGVNAMSPDQQALARATARRAVEAQAGGGARGAFTAADNLAGGLEQGKRSTALLGAEDTARLQGNMRAEVDAVRNAQQVDPQSGSRSANNLGDNALVDGVSRAVETGRSAASLAHGNPIPAIMQSVSLWGQRFGISAQEGEALAQLAIDPSKTQAVLDHIAQRAGPQASNGFMQIVGPAVQNAMAYKAPPSAFSLVPPVANAFSGTVGQTQPGQ